ncbi:hypothetical protein QZH41_001350 [Actinostola sp. cb2023]|nr:hypothetical protein QZH41_001350 [Actinostola sp. cb2023]
MLECPDPGCDKTLKSVDDMELHMSVGQHSTNIYDKLKRDWVEKFSSLTLDEGHTNVTSTEKESSEISSPTLNQGWALHKAKGGASRFSDKVRQYLTAKFEIGATSGRKEDPNKVAQDMRNAKTESGDRLFSRDEWLTKSQIQGFFSRLSSSRKRKLVPAPTSTEQQDNPEEDDVDQDELNHMTTIDNVITEIGLSHPIVYDIYDLCDYARNKKMKAFTVSMLKEICTFFDIPFMSKDTKAVLIFKLKQMTSQCSCSAEDR